MNDGGWSTTRLDRMHDVLAGYVERGGLPGLVTLVSRRGETRVDAIGTTAVAGDEPMRRDTIFRLASVTKPITAAAAMILVEACVLRLDDPVDGLLPELANRQVLRTLASPLDDTVPANRPITLRDVLTFRSGYGMVFAPEPPPIQEAIAELHLGFEPDPHTAAAPDEWIRRLGTLPLLHQPGAQWMYNIGSDILGVLIARAAGQSLGEFLHERIFTPLGMTDTGFSVPTDKRDRLATAYWTNPETGALDVFDGASDSLWSRPPAFPSGAAGLVATVDDLLAFGEMVLNQGEYGGERILSRPSVELMMADHLTPEQKAASGLYPGFFDRQGWGFGGAVGTRRDDLAGTVGRYGWDGGLGTSWYVDPREELIGILLTQAAFTSATPPAIVLDFWTLAYQAIAD